MKSVNKSQSKFRVIYRISQHRYNSKVVHASNIQEAMRKVSQTGRHVTGAEKER